MEIILFINDYEASLTIEKVLDMISYDPTSHKLLIDYVWVGPNGSSDGTRESIDVIADLDINDLYEQITMYFDHVITLEDLLLNTQLIQYYLEEDNPAHLKSIDETFTKMLLHDYAHKETEDDFILLAMNCQAYGEFLETYDFPRCVDAFMREKDLLEDVAEHHPDQENIHNAIVGYNDVIRVYEKLGEDFKETTLSLYLSLYDLKKRAQESDDYDFAHICERIGILYSEIETHEDMDDLESDASRLRLSIRYHQMEKDIFYKMYQDSHDLDDGYNYNVALRQLGKRLETLGDTNSLLGALDYYLEAYEVACTLHDASDAYVDLYIISAEHLGDIYNLLKRYDQAMHYYQIVYEIEKNASKSSEDRFSLAIIEKKIGKVYMSEASYHQARTHLQNSLSLVQVVAQGDQSYEKQAECGIAYMNLGWNAMEEKDYSTALAYFEKDLNLRAQLNQTYHTITSHYSLSLAMRHMGYVYEALHEEKQAYAYFKNCYDIALRFLNKHNEAQMHYLMVSLHDLSYCLFQLKDYPQAKKGYEEVIHYLAENKESRVHEYVLDEKEIMQEYQQLRKNF